MLLSCPEGLFVRGPALPLFRVLLLEPLTFVSSNPPPKAVFSMYSIAFWSPSQALTWTGRGIASEAGNCSFRFFLSCPGSSVTVNP